MEKGQNGRNRGKCEISDLDITLTGECRGMRYIERIGL